jgi:hypothetical protein
MPKQSPLVLKGYFNRGDKPTEDQFGDLIDSFRHKDEGVPVAQVSGLSQELSNYVTQSQLSAVSLTKITAQVTTANNTVLIPQGKLLVYLVLLSAAPQQGALIDIAQTSEILLENVDLNPNVPLVSQVQVYAQNPLNIRVQNINSLITIIIFTL